MLRFKRELSLSLGFTGLILIYSIALSLSNTNISFNSIMFSDYTFVFSLSICLYILSENDFCLSFSMCKFKNEKMYSKFRIKRYLFSLILFTIIYTSLSTFIFLVFDKHFVIITYLYRNFILIYTYFLFNTIALIGAQKSAKRKQSIIFLMLNIMYIIFLISPSHFFNNFNIFTTMTHFTMLNIIKLVMLGFAVCLWNIVCIKYIKVINP